MIRLYKFLPLILCICFLNFGFGGKGFVGFVQDLFTPSPKKQDVVDNSDCYSESTPNYGGSQQEGQLLDAIRISEKTSGIDCKELKVGQSRVMHVEAYDSPTGVEHKYRLKRTSDNQFEVGFRVRFGRNDNEDRAMRERVNNCLDRVNNHLLGPNGQSMKMRVLNSAEEGFKETPEVKIGVKAAGTRSDSHNYAYDIGCSTITHELLHLAGLCDEYKENTIGYSLDSSGKYKRVEESSEFSAYDCRAIGPDDSIMNDHTAAFRKVFKESGTPMVLECSCTTSMCRNAYKNPEAHHQKNGNDCPPGSSSIFRNWQESSDAAYKQDGIYKINDLSYYRVTGFNFNPTVANGSLLMPGHFNVITRPGCKGNLPYYQCSLNAYATSKTNKGEGCKLDPPPSSCTDSNTWLRDNFTKSI